jgi:hypothetical protein
MSAAKNTAGLPKRTARHSLRAAIGSDFRCPGCNGRAKFIQTRYFERGTADVYTCRNKKCTYYMLYFYNDHPNAGTQQRRDNP